MRTLFLSALFLSLCSTLQAAKLIYEKATGRPISWIAAGSGGHESDTATYGVIQTTLTIFELDRYSVDLQTNMIVLKSTTAISQLENQRLKNDVLERLKNLKKDELAYKELGREGLNMFLVLEMLAEQINTLKQIYLSLP